MNKELFNYVAERADVLATSGSAKQETKEAALAWKKAIAADAGDASQEAATSAFLDFLEGRPTTIDGVIAFASGPAKELIGKEAAAQMLARQQQRKANGAKYCDCAACTAATELLAKFGRLK